MIFKTLTIVSVTAAFVCIAHGYRTSNAEPQKHDSTSGDELADLKLAFSAFDKDQSGHIDAQELKEVLTAVGHAPTENQLKEIMKLADEDGNGEISLEEFTKVAKEYKDVDLSLKKTFKEIDTDGSGFITADELHAWLTKLGKKISEEEITQIIKDLDENNDNQLHFSEFIEVVKILSQGNTTSGDKAAESKLAFSVFDKDESGHITKEELKDVLTAIGHPPTEKQLKEIMELADEDNNGEISLDEFIKVAKESSFVDLTLRKTFNEIDADGSGFITADELHAWLTKLGKNISEEEIASMIKDVDENNDDQIQFSEFVEVVKNLF